MDAGQLRKILEDDPFVAPYFKGVYSIDTIPINRNGVYIMNTSPAHIPIGHWVAIAGNQFFCSLGTHPSAYGIKGITEYNSETLQNLNSNVCGLYVTAYIKAVCRGYSLIDFLSCFTNNTRINDMIVYNSQ